MTEKFELSRLNRTHTKHPLGKKCIFTFDEMIKIKIAIITTSNKYHYEYFTKIIIKNMTLRLIAPGGDYKCCECALFNQFDFVVILLIIIIFSIKF